MFEKLLEIARGGLEAVAQMQMPPVIDLVYPEGSPAAGASAGHLVLKRGPGTSEYAIVAPQVFAPQRALAELRQEHVLTDLADLAALLHMEAPESSVFVSVRRLKPGQIVAVDIEHPEKGSITMPVQRHPTWALWNELTGGIGVARDLSHHALADALLDHREDLVEPALADHLAAFRAARTVEYDADLGDKGHEGVRVRWKGAGGREGATSELPIPRTFAASIPAYTGAWLPGQEPRREAVFSLRVLPTDGATPLFRLAWVNYSEYELAMAADLVARVREVMGSRPVYAGEPSSTRAVLPG